MSKESTPSGPPPQMALYHLATGHYLSHALYLAAKLQIAELLNDGPRQAAELAAATATHAPSLQRVLRLLASAGVFEEQENGAFALTALGAGLREGVHGSMRAMVRWRATALGGRVPCALRHGGLHAGESCADAGAGQCDRRPAEVGVEITEVVAWPPPPQRLLEECSMRHASLSMRGLANTALHLLPEASAPASLRLPAAGER
jgi:hypothetical protein